MAARIPKGYRYFRREFLNREGYYVGAHILATITTDYQEVAPNLLQWSQPDGSSTIVVGTARYTRAHSDDPWTLEPGNPAIAGPGIAPKT